MPIGRQRFDQTNLTMPQVQSSASFPFTIGWSLPPELVDDLQRYAAQVRCGNKSGFVADALRS